MEMWEIIYQLEKSWLFYSKFTEPGWDSFICGELQQFSYNYGLTSFNQNVNRVTAERITAARLLAFNLLFTP